MTFPNAVLYLDSGGLFFMFNHLQCALLIASGFRLLPWNCYLLPFLVQEVVLFFNLRHLTSLSPLPVGAQMAAKGMLEQFHPYLGDDKQGFRRERWGCLCKCLNRSCVLDRCGRDLMIPVRASAVFWGVTCLPMLSCLIIVSRAPLLSRSQFLDF